MCGLAGFLGGTSPVTTGGDEHALRAMAESIHSRGPDDGDCWVDRDQRIGFGHRRLAIVDLSAAGHQPMASASGRYVIAYNGEIYNHLELRKAIESARQAPSWRGHSDTETLLAGFDAWGIRGCVERASGMFAFAVWDRNEKTLSLARDRMGEKPLYYGWQGTGPEAVFLFGSQLKALRAHSAFEGRINRDAITLLLRHNCIPAPHSIYEGIAKLPPGSILTVSRDQREPRIAAYWSAFEVARAGMANAFRGRPEEAVDELERLLTEAVGRQMMADVPLGAFLSGGIDSSTIVALMQAQSPRPVKTFTIGFHEDAHDEAHHAREVARHLVTDHTDIYLSADDALGVIPSLPDFYDEPFADSSQIPTYLVSRLAREHVTVSLSGDGGDELFAGYNRYLATASYWRTLSSIPRPIRRSAASMLTAISPRSWDRIATAANRWLPSSARLANPGDKLHKAAGVLASQSVDALYRGLVSHWDDPATIVLGATEPATLIEKSASALSDFGDVERMMALDTVTYLPDDILVKLDRASMAVSLETRVPFLDPTVVEFAWRLPREMKIGNGETKRILRRLLDRHVPSALVQRPKMGFAIPLAEWLRGPLRDWAEALLDESRLAREGFLTPTPIRRMWAEHLTGGRSRQHQLWDVLMFQSWLETQTSSARPR